MKQVLVCGGGGFIGNHLVTRLKAQGHQVVAVDQKKPEFNPSKADRFVVGDLTDASLCRELFKKTYDEVFQLAADMGGAGFIFTGENDADLMTNSSMINLNVLRYGRSAMGKIFFSSSACIYPERNQLDPENPNCEESTAYPAGPDSEYGWEKIFAERLYLAYAKNHKIQVRIARFHNIFGEEGTWTGGREKAPAALCRKVASAPNGGEIEIWGDGKQTRSFLHFEECLDGVQKLMASQFTGPVNIGSEEMISINGLAKMISEVAGKNLKIKNIDGPNGVRGRSSDNRLIKAKLGWAPTQALRVGIERTYRWISEQVAKTAAPHKRAA